ncbi:chromatin binding protein [Pholiota molesta]|nr:chromatin binding protein [Pholiota molesta]
MATQFDHIYHGMSPELGKFRVAPSGMAWKGVDSEGVTAVPSGDIRWAQWMRVARLRDHRKEKFDGFAREDHDKLATLLKNFFGSLSRRVSEEMAFTISDRTAFELPLRYERRGFARVLQPHPNAPGGSKHRQQQMGDELTEIRFYVPGTLTKLKGSDAGSQKSDNEDDEEEISAAQVFHDTIKEKAELDNFEEVLVLTPRGRYDMDMGKTYDYKVLYQSISRLFLLPKTTSMFFHLGLSVPIRQGQTLYQYLVMQFTREEEITAELNLSEEDLAKYEKLKKNYEAPTYEVVSSVFRGLANKKLLVPAASRGNREGHPGFKANLKAIQGDLFMLERYIFFVSKQPLLIELADIHQVVFSRVGAGAGAAAGRTFDIKIVTKSGPEHNFTSINKEEHEITEATRCSPMRSFLAAVGVGDDDDDDDMVSIASDDSRPKARPKTGGGGDDESSEEDEDFQASDSDAGSPSDSDSDASGAQTASDASGDLALTKKAKGKGKAKDGEGAGPKKPKAKKASDDEAMDVDDEGSKPKPKPKAKASTSAKAAPADGEPMDVDERPRPKPKPKPKKDAADPDEPPKKKVKKAEA